jgi:multicomponent Na+:H+ antiporter subunit G
MSLIADAFTILCLLAGAFFFLSGTLGVLRFPDALTRLHAVTKADNVGLGFVVFGLMAQANSATGAGKLLLVWLIALLASATSSYLIATSMVADPAGSRDDEA